MFLDEEGYKYPYEYQANSEGRAKINFRWSKNNPFKAENMRKLALELEPDVKIISNDEVLFNSSKTKIRFICPICHKEYEKKWCHWVAQEKGRHNCPECNFDIQRKNMTLPYEEICSRFKDKGLMLLSEYNEYVDNHSNLSCEDENGFRYYINVIEITNGNFKKYNKFSIKNPYAKYNLQHWCDLVGNNVQVVDVKPRKTELSTFVCGCGAIFKTTLESFMSGKQRCNKCVALDSQYSILTKKWLEEYNIKYIQEYRFFNCRYKKPLPFDYKIDWDNKIFLIEVDGWHHFYKTQWHNEEKLKEQQLRDKIKDDYCRKNGYILIRIPYWLYRTDAYKNILYKTFFG